MTSWIGPVIGAVLLGTIQELGTVGFFLDLPIPPTFNLLIVGLLLILFVVIAPNGIIGLIRAWSRNWRRPAVEPAAERAA